MGNRAESHFGPYGGGGCCLQYICNDVHDICVTSRDLIYWDECADLNDVKVAMEAGDDYGCGNLCNEAAWRAVRHYTYRRYPKQPRVVMDDTYVRVRSGDVVYIKVHDTDDMWLCKQPWGTYCAAAGPEIAKARFRVEIVTFRGKQGIRLKYAEGSRYLESNTCLYAATTGSTKYDRSSNNSKQFWVLDDHHADNVDLCYDTPVHLMDRYVLSYMAVNTASNAGDYDGGRGKVWVEAKYDKHMLPNFKDQFIFQRAEAKSFREIFSPFIELWNIAVPIAGAVVAAIAQEDLPPAKRRKTA